MLRAILLLDTRYINPAVMNTKNVEYRAETAEIKILLASLDVPYTTAPFLNGYKQLVETWNRRVLPESRVTADQPILLIEEDALSQEDPASRGDYLLIGGAEAIKRYFTESDRSFLIARLQGKGYKGN